MKRVNVQPEAEAEVREAASWYESQRPGLGLEFLLELDAAIERAAESPNAYAPQYAGVRRALSRRFPYAIYFVYEGGVKGSRCFISTGRRRFGAPEHDRCPFAVPFLELHQGSRRGTD